MHRHEHFQPKLKCIKINGEAFPENLSLLGLKLIIDSEICEDV